VGVLVTARSLRVKVDPGGLDLRLGLGSIALRIISRESAPRPHARREVRERSRAGANAGIGRQSRRAR
jgi:hypothetical protein